MNKNILWQVCGVIVLTIALTLGLVAFTENNQSADKAPSEKTTEQGTITLTIPGLYTSKEISIIGKQTPLDILRSVNTRDANVELITKEYSGLGTLVEGMAGKINGTDKKYWQYFVNGTMPQVGADALTLTDGDSVEWRFQVSEF